ncbi:MAG: efflux transporter outer membrane subunit [Verrucomicrobiota bacterium]
MASPIDLAASFSRSGLAPGAPRWWQTFQDRELNRLVEGGLENNFSLQASFHRVEQARSQVRVAGAQLFPTLDTSAESRRSEQLTESGGSGVQNLLGGGTVSRGASAVSLDWTFGLTTRYELDLWGRLRSRRNAARLEAEATRQELETARLALVVSIASAWFQLREQEATLGLLRSQEKTNQQQLSLIKKRLRSGLASALDVAQQEQLVEATRGRIEVTSRRAAVLENALAVLTGESPISFELAAPASLPGLPPQPESGLPAERILARPDVQSASLAVQVADQEVFGAIAERFPRLVLTASLQSQAENWRAVFEDWLSTLIGDLGLPLFDAGSRAAAVDQARSAREEAWDTFGETLLGALQEVEDALDREYRQQRLVSSLERQLAAAETAVERARSTWLRGQESYLRVLTATRDQQTLSLDLLAARRELLGYRIDLHAALAGPLSP